MLCGQMLVTQWTQKNWWMSVNTSSDSASVQKKVVLHLKEFLRCVKVLMHIKTNFIDGPALLSLDSGVAEASRIAVNSLVLSMKDYKRGIFSPQNLETLQNTFQQNCRQRFPIRNNHTS